MGIVFVRPPRKYSVHCVLQWTNRGAQGGGSKDCQSLNQSRRCGRSAFEMQWDPHSRILIKARVVCVLIAGDQLKWLAGSRARIYRKNRDQFNV